MKNKLDGNAFQEITGLIPFYYDKNFSLYLGNCLDILYKLPESSIDMIFADPPYNLSNDGFTCQSGKRVSVNKGNWDKSKGIESDFEFHKEWIKACRRVLKPNGTIWISGTYHSSYACGFALQLLDFKILNDIIWFKSNASPNLSCRYFTASHETIIWAIKDKNEKHTFNYDIIKNGDWHEEDFLKKPEKQMRSVWAINPPKLEEKKYIKHPTQKPIALLERIILASTNESDIILDPFTGSSTTGIVSYKCNRKFIGIDISKEYLELSIKRFYDIK